MHRSARTEKSTPEVRALLQQHSKTLESVQTCSSSSHLFRPAQPKRKLWILIWINFSLHNKQEQRARRCFLSRKFIRVPRVAQVHVLDGNLSQREVSVREVDQQYPATGCFIVVRKGGKFLIKSSILFSYFPGRSLPLPHRFYRKICCALFEIWISSKVLPLTFRRSRSGAQCRRMSTKKKPAM